MRALLFAVPMLALLPAVAAADVRATTEDGRQVLLKDDGTYEYTQPGADAPLDDTELLARIRGALIARERAMTGAPCVDSDTFAIDKIEIAGRSEGPARIDVVADISVTANQRLPNGSIWDTCFKFLFGGNGVNKGQTGSGQLTFVFSKSPTGWRLD